MIEFSFGVYHLYLAGSAAGAMGGEDLEILAELAKNINNLKC